MRRRVGAGTPGRVSRGTVRENAVVKAGTIHIVDLGMIVLVVLVTNIDCISALCSDAVMKLQVKVTEVLNMVVRKTSNGAVGDEAEEKATEEGQTYQQGHLLRQK